MAIKCLNYKKTNIYTVTHPMHVDDRFYQMFDHIHLVWAPQLGHAVGRFNGDCLSLQTFISDSGFPSCPSRALVVPPDSRGLWERLDPRRRSLCEPPKPARSAPRLPSPGWAGWSLECGPPGSSAACRTVSGAAGNGTL